MTAGEVLEIAQGSQAWVALAEAFGADPDLPPDVYKISVRCDGTEGVSVKVNESMWSRPLKVAVTS